MLAAAVDNLAITPIPAGGFPKIHLNDPEALVLGLSEAKASLIREADPNTVALVQIHGSEAARPGNLGASAETLREVITTIFDEKMTSIGLLELYSVHATPPPTLVKSKSK